MVLHLDVGGDTRIRRYGDTGIRGFVERIPPPPTDRPIYIFAAVSVVGAAFLWSTRVTHNFPFHVSGCGVRAGPHQELLCGSYPADCVPPQQPRFVGYGAFFDRGQRRSVPVHPGSCTVGLTAYPGGYTPAGRRLLLRCPPPPLVFPDFDDSVRFTPLLRVLKLERGR